MSDNLFSRSQQNLMDSLYEMEGAVKHGEFDVFANGIESPSPSFNYLFDNSWMLPDGYCLLLGGMPKGGKSVLIRAMFGLLHQQDPQAVCWTYNTELRERAQVTPAQLALWGVDPKRYRAFETNRPEFIFDRIEQNVPKFIQAGIKLRAIAIDSINDILGRRSMNADSVMKQQIGDEAKTLQDGFRRIKGILRSYNISLILTCQVRAEMDVTEQMRGNTIKFATPWYVKHLAEYYMMVERLRTKAGKTDLSGKEFREGQNIVNMQQAQKADGEETGHKVRVTMVDSSLGRPGRKAVFTLDHDRGIINTHEEAYLLGLGFKVLAKSSNGTHSFAPHDALDDLLKPHTDKTWKGKEAMWEAIRDNTDLYKGIIRTCKRIDMDRKNGVLYGPDGKRLQPGQKLEESPVMPDVGGDENLEPVTEAE